MTWSWWLLFWVLKMFIKWMISRSSKITSDEKSNMEHAIWLMNRAKGLATAAGCSSEGRIP